MRTLVVRYSQILIRNTYEVLIICFEEGTSNGKYDWSSKKVFQLKFISDFK